MPSKITITVDASNTSTFALDEAYQWRITWSDGTTTRVDTVRFDCVLEPFVPFVGLSAIVGELPDLEDRLTRQAAVSDTANVRPEPPGRQEVRQGYASNPLSFYPKTMEAGWVSVTGTPTYTLHKPDGTSITSGSVTVTAINSAASRTATTMAAQYASLAWQDTQALITSTMASNGWVRPRLIIDRERMERVVVAFAIARIFKGEGGGVDSESRLLADDWKAEAQSRFASLGPLSYDSTEDRTADTVLTAWSSPTLSRGTW